MRAILLTFVCALNWTMLHVSAIDSLILENRSVSRAETEALVKRDLAQRLKVRALADRHVPKAEARMLYDDLTPPPTAEEIEARRLERMYRAAMTPPKAPNKRQRRELRKLKGRE